MKKHYNPDSDSEHRKGNGAKELNALKAVQKYRLFAFIDNNRDRLAKLGNYDAVAKDAAENLKFPVTYGNVEYAWKQLQLPQIRSRRAGTSRTSRHYHRLLAAVEKIDAVSAQIRVMSARLAFLESQFGITPPVDAAG